MLPTEPRLMVAIKRACRVIVFIASFQNLPCLAGYDSRRNLHPVRIAERNLYHRVFTPFCGILLLAGTTAAHTAISSVVRPAPFFGHCRSIERRASTDHDVP